MTWVVFLDTGILGYVTHPKGNEQTKECTEWLLKLLENGAQVCIPEVCDYELRRTYIHRSKNQALQKLEDLRNALLYVPITSEMMSLAAKLWAESRLKGKPTADEKELDVDVILAAQAKVKAAGQALTIATTNVGHLSLFADAREYRNIPPR